MELNHMTPLLATLYWLPIHGEQISKTFKELDGLAPNYLTELLHWHKALHTLWSKSQVLLQDPRTKLKYYGDRALSRQRPCCRISYPCICHRSQTWMIVYVHWKLTFLNQHFTRCLLGPIYVWRNVFYTLVISCFIIIFICLINCFNVVNVKHLEHDMLCLTNCMGNFKGSWLMGNISVIKRAVHY